LTGVDDGVPGQFGLDVLLENCIGFHARSFPKKFAQEGSAMLLTNFAACIDEEQGTRRRACI
jgi:hypothetical protein